MGRQRRIQFSPVKNFELLSSHWLENRLPLEPEWREFAARARDTLDQLAQLWSTQRTRVEQYGNEAALEHAFIQPVLEALGWKPFFMEFFLFFSPAAFEEREGRKPLIARAVEGSTLARKSRQTLTPATVPPRRPTTRNRPCRSGSGALPSAACTAST